KVLDFGLAKATQSSDAEAHFKGGLTTPGVVMGTLSYLAPEQARGQEADPRSDVFALGVLLYEMLTGRLPFTGGTPLDTLVAILHDAPPPLPPAVEAAAAGVGLVLERALPVDMGGFTVELQRWGAPARRPGHRSGRRRRASS
ncbi:MAG: protein kinase, partial [Myxococcales bacterium]|nr:protein kinase [Myxococcales bacterium]